MQRRKGGVLRELLAACLVVHLVGALIGIFSAGKALPDKLVVRPFLGGAREVRYFVAETNDLLAKIGGLDVGTACLPIGRNA